ncbi:hypothetical protein CupriaWKF_08200 [Cupriavidus sp. WKF15]|uniref:hypothetical protein n=1 Tax=Cupriavidus sp. WKF15 TaxID=3032282 RepID=UPI0023E0B371|nr:hypothetical protein [Cupriavidus sp. WKF15]WER47513.1 hypothetical protein CupriaWKF_08200 [Cupriavidus sp. WKF15]
MKHRARKLATHTKVLVAIRLAWHDHPRMQARPMLAGSFEVSALRDDTHGSDK